MVKVAVVEDELQEQENMRNIFSKLNEDEKKYHTSFFQNGNAFFFDMYYGKYDLILLDIELKNGGGDGLQIAKKIRAIDEDVLLIFTTNLAQYAIDGYRVNAVDYLLKPITYEMFSSEMQALENRFLKNRTKSLMIQAGGVKVSIQVKDIYYVEVNDHKLIYHTSKGNFISYGALKKVASDLAEYHFSLCNSCFLVNLEFVEEINGYELKIKGDTILISHPKKKAFLSELNKFLGEQC